MAGNEQHTFIEEASKTFSTTFQQMATTTITTVYGKRLTLLQQNTELFKANRNNVD